MNVKVIGNAMICFLVFCSVALFMQKFHNAPDVVTFLKPPVEQSPTVLHMADKVILEGFDVKFGQVENRVDASFTLRNDSDVEVKNISVYCSFHDSSEKQWGDSRWAFFDTIPSGESLQVSTTDKRFVSHKALSHKSKCKIVDLAAEQTGGASHEMKSEKHDSEEANH